MPDAAAKPLNWKPDPKIGYTVERRADGGMYYVFTNTSHETLAHWREFSLQHLYDSDRLTRNLYDLRQIKDVPQEAIKYAIELNSDPSARNIRVAVVVASEAVRQSILEIGAMTIPGGVDMGIFTSVEEAEAWLNRPLTLLI